jgi:hypothetical protein
MGNKRIISEWRLENDGIRARTGLKWFRIGSNGRLWCKS